MKKAQRNHQKMISLHQTFQMKKTKEKEGKEEKFYDKKLANFGFVNYNLGFNAQTVEEHTECNALYTIICSPNQLSKSTKSGFNTLVGSR